MEKVDRKATVRSYVTHITTLYNHDEQESISESTTCQSLRLVAYKSRGATSVLLLSGKNRNLRLQVNCNWTVEDWKKKTSPGLKIRDFCSDMPREFGVQNKKPTRLRSTDSSISNVFLLKWLMNVV